MGGGGGGINPLQTMLLPFKQEKKNNGVLGNVYGGVGWVGESPKLNLDMVKNFERNLGDIKIFE